LWWCGKSPLGKGMPAHRVSAMYINDYLLQTQNDGLPEHNQRPIWQCEALAMGTPMCAAISILDS
jgi:hypothetical protein